CDAHHRAERSAGLATSGRAPTTKEIPPMHLPTAPGLAETLVVAGLLAGGYAANAQAAQPVYTVKVQHRTLNITAHKAGGDLALRLAPGDAGTLQVDVDANGSADFQVARNRFDSIAVEAGDGDNNVRIDEA